jgi:hypothetical protein
LQTIPSIAGLIKAIIPVSFTEKGKDRRNPTREGVALCMALYTPQSGTQRSGRDYLSEP